VTTPGVILVESDPGEAELLARALESSAAVARDADEALRLLDGRPARVLLVSERLPRVDGLELLQRIRADARLRHIPVVLLSSEPTPTLLRRAYTLGANSVVRKPVRFEEVRAALREVEAYWMRRNETR